MFYLKNKIKMLSIPVMVAALSVSTAVNAEEIGKGTVSTVKEDEIVSTGTPAGEELIINEKGSYDISAEHSKVIVKAGAGKVTLKLNGSSLQTDTDDPVIMVEKDNHLKVKVEGDNILKSADTVIKVDDDSDITLSGEGTLRIESDGAGISGDTTVKSGQYEFNVKKAAIISGDDITIAGGNIRIESEEEAVNAENMIKIDKADVSEDSLEFDITGVKNAFKAKEITIDGGKYKTESTGESFDAENSLSIKKADIEIKSEGTGIKSGGEMTIADSVINVMETSDNKGGAPILASSPIALSNTKIFLAGTKEENMPEYNTDQKINEWNRKIKPGEQINIQTKEGENIHTATAEGRMNYIMYSDPDRGEELSLKGELTEDPTEETSSEETSSEETDDEASTENKEDAVPEETTTEDSQQADKEDAEENTEENQEKTEEAAKIIKEEDATEEIHPVEDASPLSSLNLTPNILQASDAEKVTFTDEGGGTTSASAETTSSTSATTQSSSSSGTTEAVQFGNSSTSSTTETTQSTESSTTESESTTGTTTSYESTTESTESQNNNNLVSTGVKTMDILMRAVAAVLGFLAATGAIYKIWERKQRQKQ